MNNVGTNWTYYPGTQYHNIGRQPRNYTPEKFHALKIKIKEFTAELKMWREQFVSLNTSCLVGFAELQSEITDVLTSKVN